ncbi:MAG: magnesium/cobalt transporter CorA, partial [Bdellovibrionota bacterium]
PVHVGSPRDFQPFTNIVQYSNDQYSEANSVAADQIKASLKPDHVNWINVEGVHDVNYVQTVSHQFDLHPLTQEDICNTTLRPQFSSYEKYFFFALKMLYIGPDGQLTQEHISLVLKGNLVITFQETPGDVFGRIRDRIKQRTGKIGSRGADYLLYLLIDSIVDGYYQVVDRLGERIDALEEELRCGPSDPQLGRIFEIRREILLLRKNITPVRDLLNKVLVEGSVFQDNTLIYLKDLSDHIIQVTESLQLSMEISNVLIDTYHSMQNQRMNAVMKTLTMISTIFLPLNFIAGVYGMNFRFMPELEWENGYPIAIGAMAIVALMMLMLFVNKGWLWEERSRRFRRLDWLPFFESDDDKLSEKQSTSDR